MAVLDFIWAAHPGLTREPTGATKALPAPWGMPIFVQVPFHGVKLHIKITWNVGEVQEPPGLWGSRSKMSLVAMSRQAIGSSLATNSEDRTMGSIEGRTYQACPVACEALSCLALP